MKNVPAHASHVVLVLPVMMLVRTSLLGIMARSTGYFLFVLNLSMRSPCGSTCAGSDMMMSSLGVA